MSIKKSFSLNSAKLLAGAFKNYKVIIFGLFLALLVSGCSIPLVKVNKDAKKVLSPEQAKVTAEKFINDNLVSASITATVKNVTLQSEVYTIVLDVNGQEYTSYMTKDGSLFFQSGIDMVKFAQEAAAAQAPANQQKNQNTTVPKTDKPTVELFVMTHCPYGLQAEKGILPAFDALGSKINGKIRFVHYFMHGDKEEQETYNQVCIREEQAAKYAAYLKCFVIDGDSAKCQTQVKIDKTKLASCVANKAKNYYKDDQDLSNGYGVGGSPTLIINGVESSAGRDSASYLAGICAAFNNPPAECSKQLSSTGPSAGFGAGTASNSNSAAGCGQ